MDVYPTLKELQSFESNFTKGSKDACWEWQGHLFNGYGSFAFRAGVYGAHRLSFGFENPLFDQTLEVCHTCDNRKCVNPNHLYAGTQQQNMDDKVVRDGRPGLLSDDEIVKLLELHKQGTNKKKLAVVFKVSYSHVCWIVRGRMKRLKHIDSDLARELL